ncbi:MAG: VOC family protein [Calditrichia bacterium]
MQKITPFLWFDDNAEEAVQFYTAIFQNAGTGELLHYNDASAAASGKPEGSVLTIPFKLRGQDFVAMNGGPHFKFNPSVSFFVTLQTEAEVDRLWSELIKGGSALMDLGKYGWSEKYGWLQDRFGLSWQLTLGSLKEAGQSIIPALLFVGSQNGRAEEAVRFYTSVFENPEIPVLEHHEPGDPGEEGHVKFSRFILDGNVFIAMDGGLQHQFGFNEAISFVVNCKTQQEVDDYWSKLTSGGDTKAQQCGWLKDRFGISWQVVPAILPELMGDKDRRKAQNVTEALLQMKKIVIADLKKAYNAEKEA